MDISQARCPSCQKPMRIRQTCCGECDVTLEGDFEVSPLSRLPLEDQVFVVAFLRHHGSIKKMESLFGVSYPTVKNRLNAIVRALDREFEAPSPQARILDRLDRGEITVEQALEELE
jgi:hypothetical protein